MYSRVFGAKVYARPIQDQNAIQKITSRAEITRFALK